MATADDTKPHDPLVFLLERYEALAQVSADYMGHGSPVLTLLDAFNKDFRAVIRALDERGLLS